MTPKGSRPVWEGADGDVLKGNAPAAYFTQLGLWDDPPASTDVA
jgi:hypothetical protein